MDLLDELSWRGLIAQVSDEDGLREHLSGGVRTLYCGFDPTADSLHIGSLVPLLALRRFQLAGHRPILLLGGATGLIGDPSFRDDERTLLGHEVVSGWVDALRAQTERFLDFSESSAQGHAARICNNLDWTEKMDVISFLRDIGKHFSVNAMIARDSVRTRLDRADQGISYTEFSYMLLQGMDYLELARTENCSLQIGGSDQWGNIVSGMDLVRRETGAAAFALTLPLVTKADGSKFGKTAGGGVWLSAAKTSPYRFYQFWLNSADADVGTYLKYFTFLDRNTIGALEAATQAEPHLRKAQAQLAREVTALVHGEQAVASAERISAALFGGAVSELTLDDLAQLQQDGMDSTKVDQGADVIATLVDTGLARSTSEARKLVQGGGVRINGAVVASIDECVDFAQGLHGQYCLLRKGRKNWHLLCLEQAGS